MRLQPGMLLQRTSPMPCCSARCVQIQHHCSYSIQRHNRITKCGSNFEAHLRDTSGKGGSVRFAHDLHPWEAACGSGWRYGDLPVPGCPSGLRTSNLKARAPRRWGPGPARAHVSVVSLVWPVPVLRRICVQSGY